MKVYYVKIKGTAGLLQNKKLVMDTNLSKKSEGGDTQDKCEDKLYILDKKIVQPAINIEQAMIKVCSQFKMKGSGKKTYKDLFKGNVFVKPEYIVHDIQKWVPHQTTVVIPATKGRINRYRPLLENWSLSFTIEILDDRIDETILKTVLDEAGRINGLGDWRPRFGRFIVTYFSSKEMGNN